MEKPFDIASEFVAAFPSVSDGIIATTALKIAKLVIISCSPVRHGDGK